MPLSMINQSAQGVKEWTRSLPEGQSINTHDLCTLRSGTTQRGMGNLEQDSNLTGDSWKELWWVSQCQEVIE